MRGPVNGGTDSSVSTTSLVLVPWQVFSPSCF